MSGGGGGDRPLLVVHDEKEGYLVYDLLLVDGEEAMAVTCHPRPVAQFSSPLQYWSCSFAVSSGRVLGVRYDWEETLFHDTVMKVGGYDFWERQPSSLQCRDADGRLVRWWPRHRSYCCERWIGDSRDRPAMLPIPMAMEAGGGGGAVVRMDPVLFDGIYSFEILRPNDDGPGGWHAAPLPSPPVGRLAENEIALVSAYLALGTHVWVSVAGKGTFSLDTAAAELQWQMEGTWLLPFEGRALYIPELDSVIGLATGTRLLCACNIKPGAGTPPVIRHAWTETSPRPWEECVINGDGDQPSRPRDMPSLAYLGKGRICVCRPMSSMEPTDFGPPMAYDACSLLVVELKRLPGGHLHLAKRGKMTYMWPPRGCKSSYMGFVQPAT